MIYGMVFKITTADIMIRLTTALVITVGLLAFPHVGSYTKALSQKKYLRKIEASIVLETLTIYNPTGAQCDSTPLITASNARIDPVKLSKQELRWMALSRDLIKRWNGAFDYGDTVLVSSGDKQIDGLWVVQDALNKKYKMRGDLLFDRNVRRTGRWNNVKITRSVMIMPSPSTSI
jgi:hypothetical protein